MIKKLKKIINNLSTRQIFAFLTLLVTAICFVSLISFNSTDFSWFYYNSDILTIKNKLGFSGSNLSFLLLYLFGPSTILILIFLTYLTFFLFSKYSFSYEWDRFLGFIVFLFVTSLMFEHHEISLFGYSGIIGKFIYKNLLYNIDKKIILISLYSLLFNSFILIFRFSFISLFKFINLKRIILCFEFIFNLSVFIVRSITKPFIKSYIFINDLINYPMQNEELIFQEEYGYLINNIDNKIDNDFWDAFLNKSTKSEDVLPTIIFDEKTIELPYDIKVNEIFESSDEVYDNKKVIKDSEIQAKVLEEKLKCFGISGSVVSIKHGPVITLFEYEPHIDSKISKIISLEDDLAMALQTTSIRIIAPIPGKSVVGFEIANKTRRSVLMSHIIKSGLYQESNLYLPLIFGEDVIGNKTIFDLVKMPHLLIAGSTGSGKSIALNSMIISLLCKCKPTDLKLILIDPKRLEFTPYNDIAHLLFPIITLPQFAISALKWLIKEMENRYDMMSQVGSKNIFDYNIYCKKNNLSEIPFIVVIIDELADLMITTGKEIEDSIIRIAQMARACGIHMIVATQRPSVDVITGLIKVNFPSRLSFKVASKIDSRTILDCSGAEKLLGKGDMLFQSSQSSHLERLHGAYVTDEEIGKVVCNIKSKYKVEYLNLVDISNNLKQDLPDADDQLYKDIINFLNEIDEVSISLLQRRFKIGYNRSARIIEMLESQGYILPSEGGRPRKIIKVQK